MVVAGRCANSPGRGHHLVGGSDVPKGTPGSRPVCSIDGCATPSIARGWCAKHYDRWRNHGHPTRPTQAEAKEAQRAAAIDRFWTMVDVPDDPLRCWIWTGARDAKGYGRFNLVGSVVYTHRLAYELCLGPIRSGLTLDHLCRTPPCLNPVHLDPVSIAENVRRGSATTQTTCRKGHRIDPANVRLTPLGRLRCLECEREWRAAKQNERIMRRKKAS
jgi:hypothetical protein